MMMHSTSILDVIGADTQLKKIANTRGGEYAGPCPFCGGSDRFRVQPEQNQWWCRNCSPDERWQNAAAYIMCRDRIDYPEAMRRLDGHSAKHTSRQIDPQSYPELHAATWADFERWGANLSTFTDRGKTYRAIAFPDDTGTRYRLFDHPEAKFKPGKSGLAPCWYGLREAVVLAKQTTQPLVIVNGQPSVIACHAHGIAACTIPGGEGNIAGHIERGLLADLQELWDGPIVVLLDGDDTGHKAAPHLADVLRAAGYITTIKDVGPGHDAADHCRLHNGTSVAAIVGLPDLLSSSSPAVHDQFTIDSELSEPRAPRLLHASMLGTLPPTTWLIDGVLAMNKLSQTFAAPGSGKSFLELDKALCVSQNYPVIYIAAEAVEDYEERVAAWEAHHKQKAGEIYFWTEPIILKNPASIEAFLTEIHPIKPAAIFIDPLASCMVGLEESSTGDMTIAIDALNRIRRETGAAVHVVHHTGWNEDHERGNSSLRAACRVVMKLSLDDSGLMTLSCVKANNGKPFEVRYFRLVASGNSAVPVPANKVAMRDAPLSEKQYQVMETLDLMHLRAGATYTQIQEHTNLAKSTANKAISRLIELGSISCEKVRNSNLYRLTPQGNAELAARLEATVAGARSAISQGGELAVNWTVNSLSDTIEISRPDEEFPQFTLDSEKTAPVHHTSEQNSSAELTPDTASECVSSPQFTASSPSVHHSEFTSSPLAPSLEGEGSELETCERTKLANTGVNVLSVERGTLEAAQDTMPNPAFRDIGYLNRNKARVYRERTADDELVL